MAFLWNWAKRNKWKSLLGVSTTTSAVLYTFREPIIEYIQPLTEKVLAYAMEQQMAALKLSGKAEGRRNQLKQVSASTYKSTGEFFPLILRRIKAQLNVKQVVEELKITKTHDISTPELKKQVAKMQAEMYHEILSSRLAEYAACIYTTGLLLGTFRLYLVVLARHTLDRQPPLPTENRAKKSGGDAGSGSGSGSGSGEQKGMDPLDLIESAKRFGLNDLRSTATREAVHLHAWKVVDESLPIVIQACKQSAQDCLSDNGWKRSSYINAEEVSQLMDRILGHAHELLFNPGFEPIGCALHLTSHVSMLEHPNEACAVVIAEANCMLTSPVFVDVVASTATAIALQYSEKLQENIEASIPRDGPCEVNQEMLAAFLNQLSGADELVPTFTSLKVGECGDETSKKNSSSSGGGGSSTATVKENPNEGETKETMDDTEVNVPQCQRTKLCDSLMKDNGAMVHKLAGFGPKMAARKQSKPFIDQCIRVIREGPEEVPVDAEEVTEVLNAVIEDVSCRIMLLTAAGKSGLGKTQSTMMNVSSSTTESPLDDVLDDECLGHFLGGIFEDVVDVVLDRQNNGASEEEDDNQEAMMMQQLQSMMSGTGEIGGGGPGSGVSGGGGGGALDMEAMMKALGDGGGAGAGAGGVPDMSEMNNIFAAMGQTPPTADEMAEFDKIFQGMMGGGGNGGNGGMPALGGMGGMPNPNELQAMMAELEQDPDAMNQIMSMGNQMAAQMAAGQQQQAEVVGDMD